MCLRRCALIAFWLVLLLYLLRHPEGAAHTVKTLAHGLARLADVLARFASAL